MSPLIDSTHSRSRYDGAGTALPSFAAFGHLAQHFHATKSPMSCIGLMALMIADNNRQRRRNSGVAGLHEEGIS